MKKFFFIIVFFLFTAFPSFLFAAQITAENLETARNSSVTMAVNIAVAGEEDISALNFDIDFDSSALNITSVSAGEALIIASKDLYYNTVSSGKIRVVIYGINKNKITSGKIAELSINVAENAPEGSLPVSFSNISASSSMAIHTPVSGNLGSVSVDASPPEITIAEPSDGAFLNSNTVSIRGTVNDSEIDSVSINGNSVDVTGGVFDTTLNFDEGEHTITVSAADSVGNANSTSVSITVDITPPSISISSPEDGSWINSLSLNVVGTLDDTEISSISVNGSNFDVSGGNFNAAVTLVEGENDIVIIATDSAGNSATETISVNIDVTPPSISITSPGDGGTFGRKRIAVSGHIDDSSIDTVTINGFDFDVEDNQFSAILELGEGGGEICAECEDAAGNTGSDTVSVTVNMGDINEDGTINNEDIDIEKDQILNKKPVTEPSDVNNDGNVNVVDLQAIVNKI